MRDTVLIELTEGEMQGISGGTDYRCWGGGVIAVFGFWSLDPMAAAAGIYLMSTYCNT